MTIPFTVHYNDARAVRYTREENGLDGVSRRMVQRSDGLPFGVHHATVKAPGSYGGTSGEDVAIYALEGSATAWVDDHEFDFQAGQVLVIPRGSAYRIEHPDNDQTTLIFLTPPPSEGKHH